MTVDHGVLLNLFQSIKCDIAQKGLIMDGTALGMGLANAVSRLKDSKAKSKLLFADGWCQQPWRYSPLTAAEIAKQLVSVYTQLGWNQWNGTISDADLCRSAICTVPVEIDEQTLTQIAGTTNGNYSVPPAIQN